MTRMIIADDESVIIRGLERILDWESMGIEIVGKFTDGSSALNGILALRPDIALLDISMPHLSGIEVLVHVGVDTVNMNGDGFEGFVKADDVVKAGQPMLKIDRAKIAAAGYKDCVVVAVSNTAEFADVELAVEADSAVAAGDAIVKVVRK